MSEQAPATNPDVMLRDAARLHSSGNLAAAFAAYQSLLNVEALKADVASNLSALCLRLGDTDAAERFAGGSRSQPILRMPTDGTISA